MKVICKRRHMDIVYNVNNNRYQNDRHIYRLDVRSIHKHNYPSTKRLNQKVASGPSGKKRGGTTSRGISALSGSKRTFTSLSGCSFVTSLGEIESTSPYATSYVEMHAQT